jgi:hypothetical protein
MKLTEEEIQRLVEAAGGEERLRSLGDFVRMMGIGEAVMRTKSVDPDKLAGELYRLKEGVLPLEMFKEAVATYLPRMREEGLLHRTKPRLTKLGESLVKDYVRFLNQE